MSFMCCFSDSDGWGSIEYEGGGDELEIDCDEELVDGGQV